MGAVSRGTQITALTGEDKKAGIRVTDALRKRKLRASLKDVKIRDPAGVQRRLANSVDIYSFLSCYFPDVFCTPKSETRSWPWTGPPSGEPRRPPTASGRSRKWAQDYIVLPTVRVPDHWDQRLRPGQPSLGSGTVITTRGLDSAIRGVLVGTKRPDLVIIDDPESARLGPQRRPDGPPRSARSKRTRPDWAVPASGWPA